jgi:hypothetical protein
VSEISISTALRRQVRDRAGYRCEYCLLSEDDAFFRHEPDHIIAIKHGGASVPENLAWSCFDCNRFKGSNVASVDLLTGGIIPLFNPRTQLWQEHFQLVGCEILPLTSVARVTATLLKFNLPQRVEVRKALQKTGRYPGVLA